jgi:hypothetical protein
MYGAGEAALQVYFFLKCELAGSWKLALWLMVSVFNVTNTDSGDYLQCARGCWLVLENAAQTPGMAFR